MAFALAAHHGLAPAYPTVLDVRIAEGSVKMPPLPQPRSGQPVTVKDRPVSFSFWPMRKGSRRFGLQSHLFVSNAWAVMRQSVRDKCPKNAKAAALAFLGQAEDYYRCAFNDHTAARPVLIYYSFLNIAKAFILTKGLRTNLDKAMHGISDDAATGERAITAATVKAHPSGGKVNIFDDFLRGLQGHGLTAEIEFRLASVLPQVVVGHRLWAAATQKDERFLSIERIDILHNPSAKNMWLALNVHADDLVRIGIGHGDMLKRARLTPDWREVACPSPPGQRRLLCFEQVTPITYSHRPSDKVQALVDSARQELWATASALPPYRRHYLYLAPDAEQRYVLPQVLSIYVLIFYLGSITRYRPHRFEKIVSRRFGAQVETLLTDQPSQFLYLMASEFAEREVVRPAIV